MGLDDRDFEVGEVIEQGARGFAWVECSSAGGEADDFISWLAGETDTDNPPAVDVTVTPGNPDDDDRGPVRINAFFSSYEQSLAAAETLADELNGLMPGLVAQAEARYD